MNTKRIRLWDLPTRLFHWLLVIFILAALITGKLGGSAIEWHGRIGLVIVTLLTFRIVWGLIGSTHARFTHFFPTLTSVRAYLRGQWHGVGHNPLGAFSVIGLLALIAVQLLSGLFGNDDIAFRGPLFDLISKELSDKLTRLHKFSVKLLIALIVLHLGAILFYACVKKDTLIKPMITGWKDVPPEHAESATGGGSAACIAALLIALVVTYTASGAWLPEAPVAVPISAPW